MKKRKTTTYVLTPVTPSKHLELKKEDKVKESKLYKMVGKQFV